jgi:hypothetical protein
MRRLLALSTVAVLLATPSTARASCIFSTFGGSSSCSSGSTSNSTTNQSLSTSTEGWGVAGVVVGGLAVAGTIFAIIWASTRPGMGEPPQPRSTTRAPEIAPIQPQPMQPSTPPSGPPPPPPPPQSMMTPQQWQLLQLRSHDWVKPHARQLRADLAAGAGPTIDDLAAMAGIRRQHLAHFGRLLRAQRTELLVHLEQDTLSPDATARMFLAIGRIGWSDPLIASEAGRALAARSAPRSP